MPDVAFRAMHILCSRKVPNGEELHLLAPQARTGTSGSNGGSSSRPEYAAVKPLRHPVGVSPSPAALPKKRRFQNKGPGRTWHTAQAAIKKDLTAQAGASED